MNHAEIEERALVERYVQGRLSPEEAALFEDHFVECSQCLDALEAARDFQASLRTGVAKEVSRQAARAGLLAWLSRPGGRVLAAAALAALVVIPTLWIARGPGGGSPPLGPQVNIPTYNLGPVRSEGGQVLTSPASGWLSLVLAVDHPERFLAYRLSVRDASGKEFWRQEGVRPDHRGTVTLTLPPSFLEAGEYDLLLEGIEPSEADDVRYVDVGSRTFRLTEENLPVP